MLPNISIILPIRNEGQHIRGSLEAVLHQNYPPDRLEIIVVDGMSDDDTRYIVHSYQEKYPCLKLIDNPGRIVPTGMNAALRIAQGEIIIRVDGHTLISPDYVLQCVNALKRIGADDVGGRMSTSGKGVIGEAVALATSNPFGVGGARFHYSTKEEWVDTVYLGAWPRKVFTEIGLFDEELLRNQDDEFNYRLREHGGKILLCPDIKSEYIVRNTYKALWNQYFQYGHWKVRVMQKHPRQMRLRQFIPPLFIASLLLAGIFSLFSPIGIWLLTGIIGAYLLINTGISIITSAKAGWKHLPSLPIVFSILHVSYGLGFLIGLVRFANRWRDKTGKTPSF